jgi:hypothetical protein
LGSFGFEYGIDRIGRHDRTTLPACTN